MSRREVIAMFMGMNMLAATVAMPIFAVTGSIEFGVLGLLAIGAAGLDAYVLTRKGSDK